MTHHQRIIGEVDACQSDLLLDVGMLDEWERAGRGGERLAIDACWDLDRVIGQEFVRGCTVRPLVVVEPVLHGVDIDCGQRPVEGHVRERAGPQGAEVLGKALTTSS